MFFWVKELYVFFFFFLINFGNIKKDIFGVDSSISILKLCNGKNDITCTIEALIRLS